MHGSTEHERELAFQIPLSEVYKFNKPEKTKSLVEAHKEGPPKRTDLHPAKRFIVSTAGLFFLMIGLMGLFGKGFNPLTIIWFIAGLAIIWFFLAKPESEKRKAKAAGQLEKEVSLSLNEDNIVLRSRYYELKRQWPELIEYKKTKKGIHLYFIDGTVNWLPAEAVDEKDEMRALVELLQKKLGKQDSGVSVKGSEKATGIVSEP